MVDVQATVIVVQVFDNGLVDWIDVEIEHCAIY